MTNFEVGNADQMWVTDSQCRYSASLICPTYNERENVADLAEEIFAVVDAHPEIDLELIIVDDNSPDGTSEVAAALQTRFPVKVLRRTGKLGLAWVRRCLMVLRVPIAVCSALSTVISVTTRLFCRP